MSRSGCGYLGKQGRDIGGGGRLEGDAWQMHGAVPRIAVRDGGQELEELSGAHDRVGHVAVGDQLFLRQLSAEIARPLKAIGAYHGKSDEMSHSGSARRFQYLGGGCTEEGESGCILERGGIADIDYDSSIFQRLGQASARQRVDAHTW